MRSESRRTVLIALAANLVIAAAKIVAGLVSGSAAMLAEAAHSVADTTNQVLLLLSLARGERPPDEEHAFGHGKERFFWAFLTALLIFVSGAAFSLGEGVWYLLASGGTVHFVIAYAVLAVALVADGASLVRAVRQTRSQAADKGVSYRRFVSESKDPAPKTVLFEDSAAVVGVVFALLGVGLHQLTGLRAFDAGASIAIGILLALVAAWLARNTKAMLLGAAATPEERERLLDALRRHPGVDEVVDLRTMYLGPDDLLVAARLDLADDVDPETVADELERQLRDSVPEAKQVFLDPTRR
jgi:cation diffusion facilitator family transporter